MKSAVIVFPASNCDRDAADVLEKLTGTKPHMVWHADTEVPDVDLIVLPGGFPMAIICAAAPWRRSRTSCAT